MAWQLGRLNCLLLAEQLALDERLTIEASPTPPPTPAKKRLTTEEVCAIKLHCQQIADHGKVALKINKIETRLMIRERIGKMPLDPD